MNNDIDEPKMMDKNFMTRERGHGTCSFQVETVYPKLRFGVDAPTAQRVACESRDLDRLTDGIYQN